MVVPREIDDENANLKTTGKRVQCVLPVGRPTGSDSRALTPDTSLALRRVS